MSDHQGTVGMMTLLVASVSSILPLLNEGQGLPSVDFSTVTIQFGGKSHQEFYDCLCEDNMEECTMLYNSIFVTNVVGRSEPDMLSPIPREVTFGCDRPFTFVGGLQRYSCLLQQADDIGICGCAVSCPVSHINETHSSLCRDKCVNIIWNSCYVAYEDFVNSDAPILNSCPQPTPPTSRPVTTDGNAVTTQRRSVTTDGNPVTAHGRSVVTDENPALSENVEPHSDSTTQPQTLAIAVGVSGGILVILNVSAIIAFFYWRRKKGKTNQDRNLEPVRANHLHGTSDYSVLDAGNNAIGNRPLEHIYNNVPSISGQVGNETENNTGTGQYSQYAEISDIRTVENENNINLGQHSLYSEPVQSRAVGNEPENNTNTGQLSLYSESVETRSEVNTAQPNEYATIA
ncbi:hypothetical protein PoB_004673700 [Plakobranchus ocellatus]|uniref:Uncharacterized protein n=1 Tax=Plakobranchus ocellatus TaxID=259542 RepID=A0AAV4BLG5_9GAST|nr:hypothetical protein PoB_004673700 [Plakobranchus ocellatus]